MNTPRAQGFTLVEVLVALVIVALGMAALLGALNTAADGTAYLRDKSFAQWVALNRIAEVRLQRQRVSKGQTKGEVEFAGRKWHWEQEVADTDVRGVLRIEVNVRPADVQASKKNPQWYGTASGIQGDAVSAPQGADPRWDPPPVSAP